MDCNGDVVVELYPGEAISVEFFLVANLFDCSSAGAIIPKLAALAGLDLSRWDICGESLTFWDSC